MPTYASCPCRGRRCRRSGRTDYPRRGWGAAGRSPRPESQARRTLQLFGDPCEAILQIQEVWVGSIAPQASNSEQQPHQGLVFEDLRARAISMFHDTPMRGSGPQSMPGKTHVQSESCCACALDRQHTRRDGWGEAGQWRDVGHGLRVHPQQCALPLALLLDLRLLDVLLPPVEVLGRSLGAAKFKISSDR